MIIALIVCIILIVALYLNIRTSYPKVKMSFKESMDLVGLSIITFYSNKTKLHFLLDTGADNSSFEKAFIDIVPHIDLPDYKGSITTAGGHTIETDIAYIRMFYGERSYEGYFQLMDMTPISEAIGLTIKGEKVHIAGVIGCDFLTKYQYVLDFDKMVIYSKK